MRIRLFATMILAVALLAPRARADFLSTLTPADLARLGLAQLTPEQRAAVDAAVEDYSRNREKKAATNAAEAAVVEYKAKQEPKKVAEAVQAERQRQEEARVERFSARILGRFTGWGGGTFFALDNGQVWQQTTSETYYLSPEENPGIEIRKAPSGYYRLYLANGTWVTVKRIR